ncbi:hypothetical protein XELAEV_18038295mg [Xenopus laevis]|uniref:Glycosyltransferase family 92 protein n=1 Tax=Xenopus laevis TaxID=8355 RepID=A0A974C5S2_XENLA|nr:hypothetical protein XELAEV_18038295mg [Xenopus laevis]
MRKQFFTRSLLIMIALTSLYYHRKLLFKNSLEYKKCKKTEKTLTPLGDKRTFIIQAYYDNRNGENIRTLAIVNHKDTAGFSCLFYCNMSHGGTPVQAHVDVHVDRFGFPYGTADILCEEPKACNSPRISFMKNGHEKEGNIPFFEIKNRNPQPITSNFTVCISTMFGNYSNVLQFIQSMEMYKILGAQKVTIYKNSCSSLMETVLQYYDVEGIVDVVEWPIDSYLNVSNKWHYSMDPKDIGYYGQVAALNDCLYRNMYSSKFVVLIDPDEIILPVKYKDWRTMMEALEADHPQAGVFLFENNVFPKTVSNPNLEVKTWESIPGVNILQHIYREPVLKNTFNNRKMIVNPRTVIQTSVHSVLMANAGSIEVPSGDALLYHCREPEQASLNKTQLIRDPTLWKYRRDLVKNVDKVIQGLVGL